MKTIISLFACLACSLTAAPALAQEETLTVTGSIPDDPDTISIGYDDLNLANAADADLLRERVSLAAWQTCRRINEGAFMQRTWACQNFVVREARPQIDNAIERARTGKELAVRAVVLRFAQL